MGAADRLECPPFTPSPENPDDPPEARHRRHPGRPRPGPGLARREPTIATTTLPSYGLPYTISYLHNYGPGPEPGTFAYYDGPSTNLCAQGSATYLGQDHRRYPCF